LITFLTDERVKVKQSVNAAEEARRLAAEAAEIEPDATVVIAFRPALKSVIMPGNLTRLSALSAAA
jgi:hypothetical protein